MFNYLNNCQLLQVGFFSMDIVVSGSGIVLGGEMLSVLAIKPKVPGFIPCPGR
jgi:hypothetical protein